MRILWMVLLLAGCGTLRIDTLEHCTLENDSIVGLAYWSKLDCTEIEGKHRVPKKTKVEEVIDGARDR